MKKNVISTVYVLSTVMFLILSGCTEDFFYSEEMSSGSNLKSAEVLSDSPTGNSGSKIIFSSNRDGKPDIYVMMVGWYGVTSTGNQSGDALEKLCKELKEEFPLAFPIIVDDRYVDDLFSGSNSKKEADEQVRQVQNAIKHGNFPLKFVVKSGEKPSDIASSDGKTVKVLGYKWSTQEDTLSPGFSELNFNKRRRGAKAPNPFLVTSPSDVSKLLDATDITRRMVISKLSEIYDPLGLWEPFKLQLKLEAQGFLLHLIFTMK